MSDPVYSLKKLACSLPEGYITHPAQFHPMVIRVKEDADRMYAEDERFDQITEDERTFGVNIISKIAGNEYVVKRADYTGKTISLTLEIKPKISLFDTVGLPREMNECFIPADYCEVARPVFPEAR